MFAETLSRTIEVGSCLLLFDWISLQIVFERYHWMFLLSQGTYITKYIYFKLSQTETPVQNTRHSIVATCSRPHVSGSVLIVDILSNIVHTHALLWAKQVSAYRYVISYRVICFDSVVGYMIRILQNTFFCWSFIFYEMLWFRFWLYRSRKY